MRILHVGRDFEAMRPCGLTRYAGALMRAQAERGHEVSYLFAGRHYPLLRRPRLRRWQSDGVEMLELVQSPNSGHWDAGTREPLADLTDPAAEHAMARELRRLRPDVVHVQELGGLASSLIETVHGNGIAVVMTLHDYWPLCATVRLLDGTGQRCMRQDVGDDCARNCSAAPAGRAHLVDQTVRYELGRLKQATPGARRLSFARLDPVVGALTRGDAPTDERAAAHAAPPAHYQQRRDVNVARLNRCDRLVAPSKRTAEIYAQLGVERSRLAVQRLTLPHLESLRPGRDASVQSPLVFAVLGAGASYAKGAQLLLDAVRALHGAGRGEEFRLLLLGSVDRALAQEFAALPAVVVGGAYAPDELDALLDGADLGILPSVWEETHGFVGVEMLAKGLPLIANDVGGIPEYVVDGETGWLNRSLSADELANLMANAIDSPDAVERLRQRVRAERSGLAPPMGGHLDEVDGLYDEVVRSNAGAAAGR